MSKKISVVIPLYNKENSIIATLNSVVNQSYRDFEIIIVNDGSTDSSIKLIRDNFNDDRIAVYDQVNGGVSSARNNGISKSIGEWIIFLDADDLFEADCFEVLLNLSYDFPEADMVVGNFLVKNAQKKISKVYSKRSVRGIVSNPFKSIWYSNFLPRTGNFLIKKEVLEETGLFREDCSVYEDLELILDLISKSKLAYTPEIVMSYVRDHSDLSVNIRPFNKTLPYFINDLSQKNIYHRLIFLELCYQAIAVRKKSNDIIAVKKLKKKIKGYWFLLIMGKILKKISKIL